MYFSQTLMSDNMNFKNTKFQTLDECALMQVTSYFENASNMSQMNLFRIDDNGLTKSHRQKIVFTLRHTVC